MRQSPQPHSLFGQEAVLEEQNGVSMVFVRSFEAYAMGKFETKQITFTPVV